MQAKSQKRMYPLVAEFANGMTRRVKVKAVSLEAACKRCKKFHPNAVRVYREGERS